MLFIWIAGDLNYNYLFIQMDSYNYYNFEHMSNLDDCEHNPSLFQYPSPHLDQDKERFLETKAADYDSPAIKSRSNKNCSEPFESSFQANFCFEHIESMKKKLQNFIESTSAISEKFKIQISNKQLLREKEEKMIGVSEIIDSQFCQLNSDQKDQLKIDLKFEKKLNDFLGQSCEIMSQEFAGFLIEMTNFVMEQHTKISESKFNQEELVEWAEYLGSAKAQEHQQNIEKLKRICLGQLEDKEIFGLDDIVGNFISFIYSTIVLVIEQYFENPQYQDENAQSFKRSFSDDLFSSDQFSGLQDSLKGTKKIKMSFF